MNAMRLSRTHTRFLSLFVLAFLCFNASAVYCLAFCGQITQAKTDNCPLMMTGAHCPRSDNKSTTADFSISSSPVKCFVLPFSPFAAPLENKVLIAVDTPGVASVEKIDLVPAPLYLTRQTPKFYYRPPPNDHRPDRVRNQVFRI